MDKPTELAGFVSAPADDGPRVRTRQQSRAGLVRRLVKAIPKLIFD